MVVVEREFFSLSTFSFGLALAHHPGASSLLWHLEKSIIDFIEHPNLYKISTRGSFPIPAERDRFFSIGKDVNSKLVEDTANLTNFFAGQAFSCRYCK